MAELGLDLLDVGEAGFLEERDEPWRGTLLAAPASEERAGAHRLFRLGEVCDSDDTAGAKHAGRLAQAVERQAAREMVVTNWLTTRSNEASSNGRSSIAAISNVAEDARFAALRCAFAIICGEASIPRTSPSAPRRFAAASATAPVPQPTSSTR